MAMLANASTLASSASPWGAVANAAGALGGSVLSGIFNAASSRKAFRRQKELMQLQADLNYQYAAKQARNQYVWNRAGLEAANYNPLLAVQGAGNSGSSSWASGAPSSPMEDSIGAINNGIQASNALASQSLQRTQEMNIQAQTENTEQDTLKKLAETRNTNAEALLNEVEGNWRDSKLSWEVHQMIRNSNYLDVKAQTEASNAESYRLLAENNYRLVNSQIDYLAKQGVLSSQQADLLGKQIQWYGPQAVSGIVRDIVGSVTGIGNMFKGTPQMPFSSQSYVGHGQY